MHLEPTGKAQANLYQWYIDARDAGKMHEIVPDFHRLQLEKWIHDRSLALMGSLRGPMADFMANGNRAIDFGVIDRRGWQDERYVTAGVNGEAEQVKIDLTQSIPADSEHFEAYDVVICSEVLEHVQRPFDAVDTLWYLTKPGGTLLITSPFLWPDHATPDYPDYWRFTEGAWRLLMAHADFEIVAITPSAWTYHGISLFELMRKFEGWGFGPLVEGCTGYMVEARKSVDASRKPGGMIMPRPQGPS